MKEAIQEVIALLERADDNGCEGMWDTLETQKLVYDALQILKDANPQVKG